MATNLPLWYDITMTLTLLITLLFVATQPKLPNTPAVISFILAIIASLLLGLAPVDAGTDRLNYYDMFSNADMYLHDGFRDILFIKYAKYCYDLTGNVTSCFLISALIYVSAYIYFYRQSCPNRYFYLFLIASLALGFSGYHYNTLRAGLAIAFALIAIAKDQNKISFIVFSILAAGMHISAILIIASYYATSIFQNTKYLYYLWAVMLIALLGGVFDSLEYFTSQISLGDTTRFDGYLSGESEKYEAGLRLDFIAYSLIPIIIGWLYINRLKYKNLYYIHIYNTYILSNAIWLIFNKIPFTDRVAYLSWIFIPFILIFPICDDSNNSIKRKKAILFGCSIIVVGITFYLRYIR